MSAKRSLMSRLTEAYRRGSMLNALSLNLHQLRYLFSNPAPHIVVHCPEYVEPDKADLPLVERIFNSFKNMKEDEQKAKHVYRPSKLWSDQLADSHGLMTAAVRENDISKFHYFLANFGAWRKYIGIESPNLIRDNMQSFIKRRYLQNEIFKYQLDHWKRFYGGRKPIEALSYPAFGNQLGAFIDGHFIGLGSFYNEIYGTNLSELIDDTDHPVVADLGAGYGKLAYFLLRERQRFTFIDVDLPENVCLAAYYLMKTFSDKKALLYGEDPLAGDLKQWDLIFIPSYEIEKLPSNSIDLFVNKSSLGEMSSESVENYVPHILRTTKYFFHINHEVYPNYYEKGERGLLGYEYPVPADQFRLLLRHPDIEFFLRIDYSDLSMDNFVYLYERR